MGYHFVSDASVASFTDSIAGALFHASLYAPRRLWIAGRLGLGFGTWIDVDDRRAGRGAARRAQRTLWQRSSRLQLRRVSRGLRRLVDGDPQWLERSAGLLLSRPGLFQAWPAAGSSPRFPNGRIIGNGRHRPLLSREQGAGAGAGPGPGADRALPFECPAGRLPES
ncbi:MAG: hypothetical protein B7Z73_17235 [Planctomycetia bacterium 21-64-5]|nr:MAG: hypothetical protein B7Z73_17235 [Planctomycetia bacterium 21-64-5]